jgi:mRNA deadenylase 3'-5' endonuclease subunit Ccr4
LWQTDPNALLLEEHEASLQKEQSEKLLEGCAKLPQLVSTYASYTDLDKGHKRTEDWAGEPSYTTYGEWSGTLDYLFLLAEERTLGVKRILKIPSLPDVQPGLPNEWFPSDHVCTMAEYEWHRHSHTSLT